MFYIFAHLLNVWFNKSALLSYMHLYSICCNVFWLKYTHTQDGKESACNTGDPGSILRLGRSPGEGNGYPLQSSCLENSMDRGAWRATVHGVTKNTFTFFFIQIKSILTQVCDQKRVF